MYNTSAQIQMRLDNHLYDSRDLSPSLCLIRAHTHSDNNQITPPPYLLYHLLHFIRTYKGSQYFKHVSSTLSLHCLKYSNGLSFIRVKSGSSLWHTEVRPLPTSSTLPLCLSTTHQLQKTSLGSSHMQVLY